MKNDLIEQFKTMKIEKIKYLTANPKYRGQCTGAIHIDQELLVKAIQINSRGYKYCEDVDTYRNYEFECGESANEALQYLNYLYDSMKFDKFYEVGKCLEYLEYDIELDFLVRQFEEFIENFLSCGETYDDYYVKAQLCSIENDISLKIWPVMRSTLDNQQHGNELEISLVI